MPARLKGVRGGGGQCKEPRACGGQWLQRILVLKPLGYEKSIRRGPDQGFIGCLLRDGFKELDRLAVGIEKAQEFSAWVRLDVDPGLEE